MCICCGIIEGAAAATIGAIAILKNKKEREMKPITLSTTKEMRSYFLERTKNHINLVIQFGKLLGKNYEGHDIDKFSDTLVFPYTLLTWKHHDKNFKLNKMEQEEIKFATQYHIRRNEHHPEHWSEFNTVPVNAKKMPLDALIEMCCDWCAMSCELKNSPLEWFEINKNKRWKFTPEQEKTIYRTLKFLWNHPDIQKLK